MKRGTHFQWLACLISCIGIAFIPHVTRAHHREDHQVCECPNQEEMEPESERVTDDRAHVNFSWASRAGRVEQNKYCYEREVINIHSDNILDFRWPDAGLKVRNLRENGGLVRVCFDYIGETRRKDGRIFYTRDSRNAAATTVLTSNFIDDENEVVGERADRYAETADQEENAAVAARKLLEEGGVAELVTEVSVDQTIEGRFVPLHFRLVSRVRNADDGVEYEYIIESRIIESAVFLENAGVEETPISWISAMTPDYIEAARRTEVRIAEILADLQDPVAIRFEKSGPIAVANQSFVYGDPEEAGFSVFAPAFIPQP